MPGWKQGDPAAARWRRADAGSVVRPRMGDPQDSGWAAWAPFSAPAAPEGGQPLQVLHDGDALGWELHLGSPTSGPAPCRSCAAGAPAGPATPGPPSGRAPAAMRSVPACRIGLGERATKRRLRSTSPLARSLPYPPAFQRDVPSVGSCELGVVRGSRDPRDRLCRASSEARQPEPRESVGSATRSPECRRWRCYSRTRLRGKVRCSSETSTDAMNSSPRSRSATDTSASLLAIADRPTSGSSVRGLRSESGFIGEGKHFCSRR